MFKFGWLTITAEDQWVWENYPTAAFTLVRTPMETDESWGRSNCAPIPIIREAKNSIAEVLCTAVARGIITELRCACPNDSAPRKALLPSVVHLKTAIIHPIIV